MFRVLLIANRGEIACRVIRTARRLGIKTVAVFSEADEAAMHVAMADEAHCIGPAAAQESYLSIERILSVAASSDAEAIHPGYGFLSENAEFAEACCAAGVTFVGPAPRAIRAMGSKSAAKAIMETAGVPVTPGYHGTNQDLAILQGAAEEIGYPVLIKAVAGGGGRGMRIVASARELGQAVEAARREASAAFGDDALLIEKYLTEPRHVEVQVFGDRWGNVIHFFERDCSVQRRHQKIIEEAPAPGMDQPLRRRLGKAATDAARAINYEGAGTVEFLLDQDGSFYFMEMNTRLQVEHPITEMITDVDLVEWQLQVAAGEPLPVAQEDLVLSGHAFEARIYAEDPARDFLPAPGLLRHLRFPAEGPHVRVDAGVRCGDQVGAHYDPLIAKLIVWDRTRDAALVRLRTALAGLQVVGPATNVGFLLAIANHPAFAAAELSTRFVERHRGDLLPERGEGVPPPFLALACLDVLLRRDLEAATLARQSLDPYSPWHSTAGWRLNDDNYHVLTFRDGEDSKEVVVHYRGDYVLLDIAGVEEPVRASGELEQGGDVVARLDGARVRATVVRHGDEVMIMLGGTSRRLYMDDPAARADLQEPQPGLLTAPMPGRIAAVMVQPGQNVSRGATLMVLEAMKMEHAITAPADGTIAAIHFEVGDQVVEGAELVSYDDGDARNGAGDVIRSASPREGAT